MDMGHYLRPRYGVYAVRGRLPAKEPYGGLMLDGAANVGIRPQFEPPKELLEPHFFDFSGDLYDQTIEVEFHAFLRPEAKYESLDALVTQIAQDCEDAKLALKSGE
jgi:riboflavin kinase / FMN adenylyltransferase